MSEEEYSQFLFEKHDHSKFDRYEELIDLKGFRLPNDKNKTIYLLDENGGWCDLNGCYYNQDGQPNGWIILSKDGKKFMRFNLNTEFIEDNQNIYYSNKSFDATHLEQNQQKHKNKNEQEQQQQQQQQKQKQGSKQENRKQQNQSNQDPQKKQQQYKQKDQDGEKAKTQVNSEKTKEQQEQEEEELYVEKIDSQLQNQGNNTSDDPKTNDKETNQRNHRGDRKYNNKNRKNQKKDDQNQDNNESKKYYILNINDNTLTKEDFLIYLIEECKIKKESIIEYNENILKLAQDKDAIKLYRLNQKQQTDKVQKFIVST